MKTMKNFLLLIIIFLLAGSCILSATQEKKLNDALSTYVNARNECMVVSYVAFTYPELVKKYKEQGDSVFKAAFDCNNDTLYLQDPTIRNTVKNGKEIHVQYDLDVFNRNTQQRLPEKHQIYAVSEDAGMSWFFIDKKVYVDKSLLRNFERLLNE